MAYLERRGWCSSRMRPSTVDKSTQPCPILLSSSLASTPLISNSNPMPIGTDTISLLSSSSPSSSSSSSSLSAFYTGKRTQPSAFLHRSSLGHPTDYYTQKRIEDLHERMDDIQIASFVNFLNYHLASKHKPIEMKNLSRDLANGHVWLDLIEILSSSKLKREHGRTRFHALANVQYVLDYLKSRMHHIDISPHEIVSGNRKQILALLWMIMKTFDFPGFRLTSNRHFFSEQTLLGHGQDRSTVIKWLNHLLNQSCNTQQIYVQDFYLHTWISTSHLARIVKYLLPLSSNYGTRKSFEYLKQIDGEHQTDRDRFQVSLDLSNYCFYTMTLVDYQDKSEKCLFKFFTEFQMKIFQCLKTYQIGKFNENNPYIQRLLETVSQPTETEHSPIMNNQEQYLICLKDEHPPLSGQHPTRVAMNSIGHSASPSSSSDDGEESREFPVQQPKVTVRRRNRWDASPPRQSDSPMTNGHAESSPPVHASFVEEPLKTSVAGKEEPTNEEIAPLASNIERCTAAALKETDPVIELTTAVPNEEPEQFITDAKLTDNEPTSDLDQVSDSSEELAPTFTSNDGNQVSTSDDENVPSQTETNAHVNEISFEMESAPAEDTPQEEATPIVNGFHHEIESVPIECEGRPLTPNLDKEDGITTLDIELPVDTTIPSISCEKVEESEEPAVTTAVPLVSTPQHEQSQPVAAEEDDQLPEVAAPSNTVEEKLSDAVQPLPAADTASTDQNNDLVPQADPSEDVVVPSPTSVNEKVLQDDHGLDPPEKATPIAYGSIVIEENQHCAIADEPSSPISEQAIQPAASANRIVQSSMVTSNELRRVHNPSKQSSASPSKQAYSTVLKKSGPTTTTATVNTPVRRATEEKSQVLPPLVVSEPKTPKVSMEQRVQTVHVVAEPAIAPVAPVEEVKKSSTKSKRSRRANARTQPTKMSNVKPVQVPQIVVFDEDEAEQIEPSLPAAPIIVLQTPVEYLSTAPKTPEPTPEENPSPSSGPKSRKTKKKRPSVSLAKENPSPSSPVSAATDAAMTHRNLFVLIKEYLRDPRMVALKYVFFLFCFCFTILILVVHQ